MNKSEIIERLKNIAEHAVHTTGEEPFIMSLDDGIAVHEAIELLTNCPEIPDSCNAETVSAIPLDWIRGYIETCDMIQLRVNVPASKIISVMVNTWKQENPGAKRGEPDGNN